MIEELARHPLFAGVSRTFLEATAVICSEQHYAAGERVITEREGDCSLYLFGTGSVEVTLGSAQDLAQPALTKELVIGPGEYELFGELNWLTSRGRRATVLCLDAIGVFRIDGERLWALIRREPESGVWFMHNIANLLAERLNDTELYLKHFRA